MENIKKYYQPVWRGCELLNKGDFNGAIFVSPTGYGKSHNIDQALKELKADYIIFQGEVSEPKFFEFLQKHKDNKILIFRDMGKLLRNISFIDTLKNLIEPIPVRTISRLTYAKHQGVSDTMKFTSKIIIELNEISKKYQQDIDALKARGLFIELNFSQNELTKIMYLICKTPFEKEITTYLIKNSKYLGKNSYNLRIQNRCITIAKAAERDLLPWKKQIDLFLKTQTCLLRKMLYRLSGFKPVRRIILVKYLIRELDWKYVSTQTRISEALFLGDLFSNDKMKQALISLNPFNIQNIQSIENTPQKSRSIPRIDLNKK